MADPNEKCVLILDSAMPAGLIANTAVILGITLGKLLPQVAGEDAWDADGGRHPGIVTFPVPVLQSTPEGIRTVRQRLAEPEFQDVTAADFSDLAQGCRTYAEFLEKMARTPENALSYLGLILCGSRKKVNRLTGSIPLLR